MSADLLAHLVSLEESIYAAGTSELERLLADDFAEIGSSGRRYDKAEVIALLASGRVGAITASEYALTLVAPGVALLTYRSRNDAHPVAVALRSSLWRWETNEWRIVFHQGTMIAASKE